MTISYSSVCIWYEKDLQTSLVLYKTHVFDKTNLYFLEIFQFKCKINKEIEDEKNLKPNIYCWGPNLN